jgi:hypothetical protein
MGLASLQSGKTPADETSSASGQVSNPAVKSPRPISVLYRSSGVSNLDQAEAKMVGSENRSGAD